MANIKQQKKRILTAQRQRTENLRYRSTIKTLFNRLQLVVDTGDKDAAAKTHQELVQLLDRSITRGTLHRNTAARKKARAARMLLQEAKTDATTIRKAKKKAAPRKPKAETAAAKKPAAKKPAAAAKPAAAKKPAAKKPAAAKDDAPVEETTAPEAAAEETAPPKTKAKTEAVETPADEAPAVEEAPAEAADDADAEEAKD